ncbi:MAG TPA: FmdB family zinc ribbon protein [Candidatus Limnocylindrales bacterium]
MPIHDYVCANCGHTMEVMHAVHGHGPTTCPQCGGPIKRAFAAPAVHFKGSGWARKDRSGTGKPNRATSKEPGSVSAEKSASTSGESAPSTEAAAPAKETD